MSLFLKVVIVILLEFWRKASERGYYPWDGQILLIAWGLMLFEISIVGRDLSNYNLTGILPEALNDMSALTKL
jgi:hypothetical protein